MKIHDEIDDWSAGALCGALTTEEQKNFERHLADCPRCRSQYEEDRKMNDMLQQALVQERPDPNFERRVIAGFREKIAQGWFHPWRGLVWFVQFRTVQAALAILLFAAMVKGGSLYTGERFGGGNAQAANHGDARIASASTANGAGTLSLQDGSVNTVNLNGNIAGVGALATNTGQADSSTTGDMGFAFVSTYYSRGILQGPQEKTDAHSVAFSGATVQSPVIDNSGATLQLGNGTTSLGANSSISNLNFTGTDGTVTNGSSVAISGNIGGSGNTSVLDSGIAGITFSTDQAGKSPAAQNGGYFGGGDSHQFVYASGTATLATGGAVTLSGTGVIGGAVTTNTGGTFNGSYTDSRTISGTFSNDANGISLVRTPGMLALNAANTYSGSTTIKGGELVVSSFSPDNQNTRVTVQSGSYNGAWNFATTQPDRVNILPRLTSNPATLIQPGGEGGAKPVQGAPLVIDTRKLIRNAALSFEVGSFEKSLDTITSVAGEEQGYVFSQNSAKGPNGKLQGEIVVKVMPGNLDRFLLKLRLLGDMKNQTVSAQDVTKDYYDTEARIRNAEVTEARMIDMLKNRTGKVSDLLEVENEIAKVRGEIEQMQGQNKYLDAQVQFATVVIDLQEKDINQTAAYLLTEHAQLSLFAKDVEKAFDEAKSEAADAKAQTLESHIERSEDGRVVATLHLLLPPENSDEAIIKLKAIGRIQQFVSQTERVARDGSASSDTAKVDRDKTELNIVIQRDAENPVQGTNISIQTDQVEDKTNEIKQEAAKEGVEVKGAEFNRLRNGVEVSALLLRMPMKNYNVFLEQIKALGKVKDFTVARREDSTATGDAPAEIVLQIFSQGSIVAPETGLWVTIRHTLGEGMSALMWSLRMAGVSLAFIAPWAVIAALVGWLVMRRKRRMANKRG